MPRFFASLTLLWLLASLIMDATAQDWPWWRGTGRDGKVSGFTAPAAWPGTLTRQWRTTVGAGNSTPALVGERLYAFGRLDETEVVFCLNARDGKVVWRHAYPAVCVTGPAEKYGGPRSSPAVSDGKVVALGVGGVLTCFETATGKVVWRHETLTAELPLFFTSTSPLVTEGLCVVHLGGKDAGLLAALELSSGKVKWQWNEEGPAYASPMLLIVNGATQVMVQTEQSLTGLSLSDGKPLWRTPTAPRSGYWNSATPVTGGDTVIFSGQGDGTRAVRIEGQGDKFVARNIWHNGDLGTVYNTPVLKDGWLFALSDRGRFFCLNQATGATQWVSTNRFSNFGSIMDAGTVLVALPEESGLVFFKPSREGYQEVARYPVSNTPVYAHPVLAGRRIFVRDADSVTLWTLDSR
jgi:outer membrane protein assembly factor BamB